MNEMDELTQQLTAIFGEGLILEKRDTGHETMGWPKLLPVMHMTSQKYTVPGYGNLFTLVTNAMRGTMELATIVCTPYEGKDVPFLLIDVMKMKKKQAVFVEYYDCTAHGCDPSFLQPISEKYQSLQDYEETPAWYVEERMKTSLIKGGQDWAALKQMALDSMRAYHAMVQAVPLNDHALDNQKCLADFQKRMIEDGNPSSATMNKVLGKEEAEHFFTTAIMPVNR